MCAAGSHDITFDPASNWMTPSTAFAPDMMLWWVSCTPFGGPVVPEV